MGFVLSWLQISKFSAGQIAGIVLGAIVFTLLLVVVVFLIVWCVYRRCNNVRCLCKIVLIHNSTFRVAFIIQVAETSDYGD